MSTPVDNTQVAASKSRKLSPCRVADGERLEPQEYACPTPPVTAAGCSTRPTSSSCISHLSATFTTQRSIRSFNTKDQFIYAAIEDLADWFAQLYADLRAPIHIDAENFLNFLASGEILCRHANYIELWVKNVDHVPDLQSSSALAHLRTPIAYRLNAQAGSFHARDNVCKFILWCREKRIDERGVIFETEDLVSRKNTNNVIYCLLDVARFVGRNCQDRVPLPGLIMLERDIEIEELRQQQNDFSDDTSACSEGINTSCFTPASSTSDNAVGLSIARPNSVTSSSSVSHGFSSSDGKDRVSSSLNSPAESSSAGSGGVEDEVSSSSTSSSRAANSENANAAYAGDEKRKNRNHSDAVRLNLSGSFTSPASNSSKRNSSVLARRRRAAEVEAEEANRINEAAINNERRTTLMQRNIDALVQDTVRTCSCSEPLRAEKISAGKFLIGRGAMTMTIYVRVLRYHIMVRVGGGWTTLSEFLEKHDPCRLHHNSLPASDVHAFLRSDSNFCPSSSPATERRLPRTSAQKLSTLRSDNVAPHTSPLSSVGSTPPVTLMVNNNNNLDSGLSGCESPSSSIVLIGSSGSASQQQSAGVPLTENTTLDDTASSSADSIKRHSRASSTTSTSFASETSSSCFDPTTTTVPSSSSTIALTMTPSSITVVPTSKNTHGKNCKISPINYTKKQQRAPLGQPPPPRRSLSSSRSVITANAAAAAAAQSSSRTQPGRSMLRPPSSGAHRPRTAAGLMTSLTAENIVRRPMSSATAAVRYRNHSNIPLSLPIKQQSGATGASQRSRCTASGESQVIQPRSFSSTRGLPSGSTFQVAHAPQNGDEVQLAQGFDTSRFRPACAGGAALTPAREPQEEKQFLSLLRAPTPVKFSPTVLMNQASTSHCAPFYRCCMRFLNM